MHRRAFLLAPLAATAMQARRRPNVVLVISDDQGYGDLSIHGNPHLATPNIDAVARAGLRLDQFHVNPVCSPTRSSLMTGRYYYRTGVVDTFLGRSMMHTDEITIAEILRDAGYRTGHFGKWHMGDHWPLRAIDQGFEVSLTLDGGGIGQPSDPPEGSSYFDAKLRLNGKPVQPKGYCTDVFFDAATQFIEKNRAREFFVYLPTNAPHDPLQVDEKYVKPFLGKGLDDATAKTYGMLANLDENMGRMTAKLKTLGLEENTILIFMTDNGPQRQRYNSGMRGIKATVYEGGIRVPFFLRWPVAVKPGRIDRTLAAHIDVMPTLAEVCGGKVPRDRKIDGRSLMPIVRGDSGGWADRTMFFQWHRGNVPEMHRAACARNQRWKLVEGRELYDLENDPAESKNVAAANPEIAARLRKEYEEWFRDVSAERNFQPPRIPLGTEHENPVLLTRQDWRVGSGNIGHWSVTVPKSGKFEVKVLCAPAPAEGVAELRLNGVMVTRPFARGAAEVLFADVNVPQGDGRLEAILHAVKDLGVLYVSVRRL